MWRQISPEWHKEAHEEGRAAAIAGESTVRNTYSVFSPLYESWNKGYCSATNSPQEKEMSYVTPPNNLSDATALGMGRMSNEGRAEPDRTSAQREMPKYECHKQVWALKIAKLELDVTLAAAEDRETTGGAWITPAEEGYAKFHVPALYVAKHNPREGGYYVAYADGYKSFSPSAAFEEGYNRI